MASLNALIGCWYKDLETGQQFEVVATDEGLDTIEVQLIDGEICEYDLDSWRQLKLTGIEEPEDWRNAFELSDDDYRHWDDGIMPEQIGNPLHEIETDVVNGILDEF
ncbi:DUF6763 family protein [Spongiibacter marinus]|uniref:DUF6763 family protein n=1 Tax=Spongiibacter marinus TaxID=354246 RepID=UPI0035622DB2